MKFNEYFTVSYYLPEGVYQQHKEMAKYLRNSHFCKRGLHAKEAEHQFIRYVQQMKEYGAHLYSAIWVFLIYSFQFCFNDVENVYTDFIIFNQYFDIYIAHLHILKYIKNFYSIKYIDFRIKCCIRCICCNFIEWYRCTRALTKTES